YSTANPLLGQYDILGPLDGKYKLTINLKDKESGLTGSLFFTGQLQGQFSSGNANVTNLFDGPISKSITLGNNTYTVDLTSYTPPGSSNSSQLGAIGAHIHVEGRLPEPSSIALAVLGVGLIGARGFRSRSRRGGKRDPQPQQAAG